MFVSTYSRRYIGETLAESVNFFSQHIELELESRTDVQSDLHLGRFFRNRRTKSRTRSAMLIAKYVSGLLPYLSRRAYC